MLAPTWRAALSAPRKSCGMTKALAPEQVRINVLLSGALLRLFVAVSGRCFFCNELVQIVAVRSVGTERPFIKKAFDAAPKANLIGMFLIADWPAHLAVPATSEHEHRSACNAGRH